MNLLELRPGFVTLACLACYLLPGRVFWTWTLLCALHELGHLAALALCGVRVERVRLRALGAVIETNHCSHSAEAICALAGPAVSLFAFWALRRALPGAALISLLLGICNLLPVWPLDGGRVLRAACAQFLPLRAVNIVDAVASACTLAALGLAVLALLRRYGLLPVFAYALLLLHIARERNLLLPSRGLSDIM